MTSGENLLLTVIVIACSELVDNSNKGVHDDQHPLSLALRGQPYIDPYFGGRELVQFGRTALIGCRVYAIENR